MPRSAGALLAAALAVLFAGCDPYVQGNGVYLEEDRSSTVGPFAGLHVEDGFEATVTAGAASQSVVVSGDANVVKYVKTVVQTEEVRGNPTPVLHVSVDVPGGDFSTTIPLRAVIHVADLRFAYAQEGSQIDLRDAATPVLVLEGRSGSEAIVRGTGGAALYATLDDAALDAGSYVVSYAEVALTAGSRIELHADGIVTGTAQGGSEVDNLLGSGTCAVTLDATSTLLCAPP